MIIKKSNSNKKKRNYKKYTKTHIFLVGFWNKKIILNLKNKFCYKHKLCIQNSLSITLFLSLFEKLCCKFFLLFVNESEIYNFVVFHEIQKHERKVKEATTKIIYNYATSFHL